MGRAEVAPLDWSVHAQMEARRAEAAVLEHGFLQGVERPRAPVNRLTSRHMVAAARTPVPPARAVRDAAVMAENGPPRSGRKEPKEPAPLAGRVPGKQRVIVADAATMAWSITDEHRASPHRRVDDHDSSVRANVNASWSCHGEGLCVWPTCCYCCPSSAPQPSPSITAAPPGSEDTAASPRHSQPAPHVEGGKGTFRRTGPEHGKQRRRSASPVDLAMELAALRTEADALDSRLVHTSVVAASRPASEADQGERLAHDRDARARERLAEEQAAHDDAVRRADALRKELDKMALALAHARREELNMSDALWIVETGGDPDGRWLEPPSPPLGLRDVAHALRSLLTSQQLALDDVAHREALAVEEARKAHASAARHALESENMRAAYDEVVRGSTVHARALCLELEEVEIEAHRSEQAAITVGREMAAAADARARDVEAASDKERRALAAIDELTDLVREQKVGMASQASLLEKTTRESEATVAELRGDVASLKRRLVESDERLQGAVARATAAERDAAQARSDVDELQTRLEEAESAHAEALAVKSAMVDDAQEALRDLRRALAEASTRAEDDHNEELLAARDKQLQAEQGAADAERKCRELERTLALERLRADKVNTSLRFVEGEVESLRSHFGAKDQELAAARQEVLDAKGRAASAEERASRAAEQTREVVKERDAALEAQAKSDDAVQSAQRALLAAEEQGAAAAADVEALRTALANESTRAANLERDLRAALVDAERKRHQALQLFTS